MTDKTATKTEIKKKRLPKSQRKYIRRMKSEARKAAPVNPKQPV